MGEAVLDVVQEWRGKGGGVSSGFEPAKALVRKTRGLLMTQGQ